AFDQTKIAAALSKLTGNTHKPGDLPLAGLRFDNSGAAFFAAVDGTQVRCVVADSACAKVEPPARGARGPIRSSDGKWEALINNDYTLFPNPYEVSDLVWRKDSRAFTFEYNQRGHQVYRVIEVAAATGKARSLISDESKTFFYYRPASGSLADSGKKYRFDV